MKPYLFLIAAMWLFTISYSQTGISKYDKSLADSLGSDQYGMKSYVFVILKTGSVTITDTAKATELFRGHMTNINRLAKEGKLVLAGPFRKNESLFRGLFILNVTTLSEAHELLKTDPAIREGVFNTELYEWYGSAALPMYLPYHEKVQQQKP